jgi:hypothetical protein
MHRDPIAIGVDEEIIDLLPAYIAHRWQDIEIAGKALQDVDFETLRSMGHAMKGSGGGYGLDEVSRIGEGIEASAKEGDSARIAHLLERLRDFLERVQAFPVREE